MPGKPMKRSVLLLLCLIGAASLSARDGYKIDISFRSNIPDSMVYLVHYFGKSGMLIKADSARVKDQKHIRFARKQPITGGSYLLAFNRNSQFIEFLLDNGADFSITADTFRSKSGGIDLARISFRNHPENERYLAYNKLMETLGDRHHAIMLQLAGAKNEADSTRSYAALKPLQDEQLSYRRSYIRQYPNTLLSSIFKALVPPEVPAGPHYLEDGVTPDSTYTYHYSQAHYWDQFDFADARLLNTPVYDNKLNDYFDKCLYPIPDTINSEADKLLARTRANPELFRYTLRTLTNNALQSKIMGMDEVFVHLVERYYMKGDAYWLDSAGRAWYENRARSLSPTTLGNVAPDLVMQDIWTSKDLPLHSMAAPYTLLIIWSYDCGHCRKEIPLLDSLYRNQLAAKGVKVYSVASGGDLGEIRKFVEQMGIKDWVNVADFNSTSGYKSKYDAYTTPKIFLMDRDKKLIGKGLDHSNIYGLIEHYEKKKKANP